MTPDRSPRPGIALGMSYRRAWLLVDDMNNCFREPVVAAQAGGSHGGGAALTPFGMRLIEQYRAIEAEAHSATAARLDELEAACKEARETASAPNPMLRCGVARSPARIAFPEEFGGAVARGIRRPATPASKSRSISTSGGERPHRRPGFGSRYRSARGGFGSRRGCSTRR